ncbi:hypothetical protein HNQ69_001632 [Bartonella callosciuri]|uniref:Uncharacterized protein n=1 Tax=Bartonella callosciuri TaxID=686223 RepID=A0A840NTU4_9HYPH|nr:hypothetical protein [Bartonella callosciuri]MBB5074481.1 hypothetical protein [Bartonella callosciuri]
MGEQTNSQYANILARAIASQLLKIAPAKLRNNNLTTHKDSFFAMPQAGLDEKKSAPQ